jgi:hypothetical protein
MFATHWIVQSLNNSGTKKEQRDYEAGYTKNTLPQRTPRSQKQRARQRLRLKPLVTPALITGAITFFIPAGGSWMSTESGLAAMGRIISPDWLVDIIAQLVLSLLYGAIIASAIYSLPTGAGIVLGTFLGFLLYAANWLILRQLVGFPANELHAGIAHVIFALFFSVAYKAAAVPPPRNEPAISSSEGRRLASHPPRHG